MSPWIEQNARACALLLPLFLLVSCAQPPTVRFCPDEDCLGLLVNTISGAQERLDCAFYDLSDETVLQALRNANRRGIPVRIILDKKNRAHNLSFARLYNITGLMHHKFCVADGTTILTGSMNPTERGHSLHQNNVIVLESRALARRYTREFEEMWQGEFPGNADALPQLGSRRAFFCPEDDCLRRIVHVMRSAKESIYGLTFTFTEPIIGTELILAHHRNVSVRIVVDPRQSRQHSEFYRLVDQSIAIHRYTGDGFQHNKVWIIDNRTVITGSMNPTWSATHRNAENILVLHDKAMARQYLNAFERISSAS